MINRPCLNVIPALLGLAAATGAFATELTPQAVTAYTGELSFSPQLNQMGVPAAWRLGATGLKVTVSVIDTGVNEKHTELKSAVLRGFNTSGARVSTDTSDTMKHGTHVAGIIAAAANNTGMAGVAPEAKILPIKVADRYGSITGGALDRAFRLAADKTPIANASLGGGPGAEAGLRYAVGKGMLLVAAAGNEGTANPSWPARYAKESWAMGRIIAVGAVDKNNAMPSWSNRAGDTRQFYLVAPGVSISSTYGAGFASMNGTSMAAPAVAGVAALVKSYWPTLKAEEVAAILFRTATDLGAAGVDDTFGWGLVNAERAMQPVGTTTIATVTGPAVKTKAVVIRPPRPSGKALSAQSIFAMGQDEFGRGFTFDLAAAVRPEPERSLVGALNDAGRRAGVVEKILPDGSRYAAVIQQTDLIHPASSASPLSGFEARNERPSTLGRFSLVNRGAQGEEWAVGGNGFAHHFFGAMSELAATRDNSAAGANPLFSLVAGHSHVGVALPLYDGWKIKTGVLTTATADAFADQEGGAGGSLKSSLVLGSVAKATDRAAVSLSVGQLAENESLLGSRNGDGLRIDGSPRTRFAAADGAWKLGENWAGYANYTVAVSLAHNNATSSLIRGNSAVQSNGWTMGLMRADTLQAGDRMSLQIAQPLRVQSGALGFVVPQGEDEAGNVRFAEQTVSLAPAGRELRAELHYAAALSPQSHLSGFLLLRAQPGHDRDLPNDTAMGLRWNRVF